MDDQTRAQRLLDGNDDLAARVARVRLTGIATTHIAESDITAAGAPVFDDAGLCATIAVIGTTRTLPVRESHSAYRTLADAAYALGKELGGERHCQHAHMRMRPRPVGNGPGRLEPAATG